MPHRGVGTWAQMWYFAAPLCGTLLYNVRNPRASPATRASHIGYVPTPLRGICCPCPPAVMHHLTHLWIQCMAVAMQHLPICGRNVWSPSHARSAYRNLACGEPRVAGDATGCMAPLHNHAASRRRKIYYRRYISAVVNTERAQKILKVCPYHQGF